MIIRFSRDVMRKRLLGFLVSTRVTHFTVGWRKTSPGFTLAELLIVIATLGILGGLAVPLYADHIEKAKVVRAIAEIRVLEKDIVSFELENKRWPDSLGQLGRGSLLDPWSNQYQYLNFEDVSGKGKMRKDRFLVPLNSDYDLYSMGRDGKSQAPLTAKASHDDIIRADDGSYVGLASKY